MLFEPTPSSANPEEKAEFWDLYDENGKFVRTMQRGRGYVPNGLYHITVEIIATDRKGNMLVTQRSLSKKRDAGFWEFPAGSVLSNEDPEDAAARELYEETGLRAVKLQKIHGARIPGMYRIAYLATIPDLCNQKVRLQEGETMDYRFVSVLQWHQMIASGQYSSSRLRMYTQRFYQAIEKCVGIKEAIPQEKDTPKRIFRGVKFGGD